ncbi:MAG: glycosyltransferase family 2 protein [Cytophagales bacterium]|nr:glycosyltransferase family 2 protein [Cytophaga sp.]
MSNYTLDISVVIPLYNEEESLPELELWLREVMLKNNFKYELIFVDDGSTDNSWEVIQKLTLQNSNIHAIRFNRNYGKSAGLNVGFKAAKGEVVITMDADLQDSPDEIPELYKMIKQDGFHLVSGWKKKRFDPISKTIPTKLYNAAARFMSGIKLNDFNCGLKAYQNRVIKSVEVYGEMHRYIPVIAKWNGFAKIGEKVVEHRARKYGYTKFGLERFIYGPLDLLSISFVSKFKKRPMHFFGSLGVLSFLVGLGSTLYLIADKLYHIYVVKVGIHRDVVNNTWFYLALIAIVIGVQLFMAGFLGEMMIQHSDKKNDYLVSEEIGA